MNDQIVLNRKDLEELVRLYNDASKSEVFPKDSRTMFSGAAVILMELLGAPGFKEMNIEQRELLRESLGEDERTPYEDVVRTYQIAMLLNGI